MIKISFNLTTNKKHATETFLQSANFFVVGIGVKNRFNNLFKFPFETE